MESTIKKLLLPSGRGAKLATLTYKQVDDIELAVGANPALATGQGFKSAQQYAKMCSLEAIAVMVVELTEANGLSDEDIVKPETRWRKVGPAELNDHIADFFSAKDVAILRSHYAREFDVTQPEVEKILGKAVAELSG